jgi:hypothetical protein
MPQLSNTDMGLSTIACGGDLAAGAAVLYVAMDYERAIAGVADPSIAPWPAQLREPGAAGGTCGAGRYASFSVNGEPFFAWIGLGDGVSEADRATVTTAFESMMVDDAWSPTPPEETTPAYVIAGGTLGDGEPWRLDLRASERSPELSLEGVDPSFVGIEPRLGHDPVDPATPIEICCGWTDGTRDTVFVDVTFGFVRKDASGVELQVREGDELTGQVLSGTIVPVPPSLGSFGSDLFFIHGTAGLAGQVVPIGIDGSVDPPPVAEPRDEVVELSGSFDGRDWSAQFSGAFSDETACIAVTIGGESHGSLCQEQMGGSLAQDQSSMHGWQTSDLYLLTGTVPPEIVEIRFLSDDDAIVPTQFRCAMGPLGWTSPDRKVCAIALPPAGSGTFEYLDADGNVLFEEGMGWAEAEAGPLFPAPVTPVHGGTYWAVYPWVGAAGSPEADDVSAQLLDDFGIEAFPGDLACDQGAAEALGTDAEQGIAVYFETEDEANDFAQMAGLLDHTRRVIAHVTTYCLD